MSDPALYASKDVESPQFELNVDVCTVASALCEAVRTCFWAAISVGVWVVHAVYWCTNKWLGHETGSFQDTSRLGTTRACRLFLTNTGGIIVKAVQLVAPQIKRCAPHVYDILKEFCDEVPCMTPSDLSRSITSTYIDNTFVRGSFQRHPIDNKAGHIGQAHLARLIQYDDPVARTNPHEVTVVVKIKRYGIDQQIHAQLIGLGWLAWWIETLRVPLLSKLGFGRRMPQLTRMLLEQLDFEHERRETEWFAHEFRDDKSIRIPRVYGDACTPNCLVLEYLPGKPLHRLDDNERGALQSNHNLKRAMVTFVCRTSYMLRHFQADPHPGNVLYLPKEQQIGLIDFGLTGRMTEPEAEVEKAFLCAVINSEWPKAARILTDHLFVRRCVASSKKSFWYRDHTNAAAAAAIAVERMLVLQRLQVSAIEIMQRTLGGTQVRYQDFAYEITPLYLDLGFEPNTVFTVFEMTLVASEGSLSIAFPKENIWDMFREIGEDIGLPLLAASYESAEKKLRKQNEVVLLDQLEQLMGRR